MYELFWIARVMHKIVSIGLSALFVGSKLPSYVLGDQRKYLLLLFRGFRVKGISIPLYLLKRRKYFCCCLEQEYYGLLTNSCRIGCMFFLVGVINAPVHLN
jgi:hypothetical protein